MDNVIHTLCGLALARAGVDKLGPWSTGTLLVASNIPDLGGVMLLWGDQQNYLQHHRGITHGVPGLLLQGDDAGVRSGSTHLPRAERSRSRCCSKATSGDEDMERAAKAV